MPTSGGPVVSPQDREAVVLNVLIGGGGGGGEAAVETLQCVHPPTPPAPTHARIQSHTHIQRQ